MSWLSIYLRRGAKFLFNRQYRVLVCASHGFYNNMPDREYISRRFKATFGYQMDFDNPKTYNEKVQLLKLYDRKPIYTTMVDKYEVKQFAASIIGEQYIVPNFGVWDRAEDIDFDALPDQFVLKCTHDSHSVVLCRDKSKLDTEKAKKLLNKALKRNFYYVCREWPYKDVKPRIIAEQFLDDPERPRPNDYKIYTFHGKAYFCAIYQERDLRDKTTKINNYDRDFNRLDFAWALPPSDQEPEKPENYDLMFELAEKLSVGTPTLRVDFYEICGRLYLGELTFYNGGGFDTIHPAEWDRRFGDLITLPDKT